MIICHERGTKKNNVDTPGVIISLLYLWASTPKSKANACVSCDLPFDESDIAPELRRNNSSVDAPEGESPSVFLRTNLEEVDISIDLSASGIPLTPPQSNYCEREMIKTTMEGDRNQETIYYKTSEKRKEQEELKDNLEKTAPTAVGVRVQVINSPADIYKHFRQD